MAIELWAFRSALSADAGDMRGMSVEALDGSIGKVQDVVDSTDGAFLLVDTGPWIFGKTVRLPAGVVTRVDRDQGIVSIDRTKEEVKNAPEADPEAFDETAHDAALTSYYSHREGDQPAPSVPASGLDEPTRPAAGAHEAGSAQWQSPASSLGSDTGVAGDTEPGPRADAPEETGRAAGTRAETAEETTAADADEAAPKSTADERTETRSATRPGRQAGKARARTSRRSSDAAPIAGYDSLTAAEVISRLRNLTQRELAEVERYEKRRQSRQTITERVAALREKEPWKGYDDATVDDIRKKLRDADADRAKAVRDYERRHRERKGVMEAARRTLAVSD